jgi:hypothetical protein
MAKTEAKLLISAEDQTKAAFESIKKRLGGLDKDFSSAKASIAATSRVVGGFVGALAAAAGISASIGKIVEVNREFGKLEASLVTVTGSAESASEAFRAIEQLAARTPFSVSQLTEAFIKLKALGLEPSEEAMISYGNTASAMGKDLMQMIEAVADAATGEFERLKEFGIKASKEGNKVRFTFKGITTEVRNDAQEITDYLMQIGQTDFAGAMERQAETLDGAFSNAGDAVDRLARTIGEAGITDLIIGIARAFEDAVDWASQFIDSFQEVENRTNLDGVRNEIHSINDEILRLADRRAKLSAQLAELAKNGIASVVDNSAVERINQQIDDLEKRRERLIEQARKLDKPLPTSTGNTPNNPPPSGGNGSTGDKIRERIDATIERLRIQAATLGMTSVEAELYQLKMDGASEAQLKAARTALEAVEAYKAFQDQQKESADAADQEEERQKQLKKQMEQAAEAVRDLLDPLRPLRQEMDDYLTLLKHGEITQQEYAAAIDLVKERMRALTESASETGDQMSQFAIQAARNIQSSFADFLFDPFKEGMDGMLTGFTNMLRRMAAELAAQEVLKAIFGGLSGGATAGDGSFGGFMASIAAGINHDGGIAGGAGRRRNVSAAAFIGAPRFHSGGILGLSPNEVPAILERGEEVLTRSDPRHAANGGGVAVNVSINALDSRSFLERAAEVRQELAIGVAQAMRQYNLGSS